MIGIDYHLLFIDIIRDELEYLFNADLFRLVMKFKSTICSKVEFESRSQKPSAFLHGRFQLVGPLSHFYYALYELHNFILCYRFQCL